MAIANEYRARSGSWMRWSIGLGILGLAGAVFLRSSELAGASRKIGGARARRGSARERNQMLDHRIKRMLHSGPVIANPGGVTVQVNEDVVTLSGPVFSSEIESLLQAVRAVDGVGDVINKLEAHDRADGISGLQGRPFPLDRAFLDR